MKTAVVVLCLIAAGTLLFQFISILRLLSRGAIDGDTTYYFMVGRGILNGLKPYVDLFESKPPGIFLVSAVSLFLTGGVTLAVLLNVIQLALLPILLAIFAYRENKSHTSLFWKVTIVTSALALGTLIALYLEVRSGAVETEAFGSFFGVLYAWSVYTSPKKFSYPRLLLHAFFLFCSIGFKETFLPINLATALLLARDHKHFFRSFVLPLVVAVVVGILLLLAMGILGPYLFTYLPAMSYRTAAILPPALVALNPFPIYIDLSKHFKETPTLALLIASLWMLYPVFRKDVRNPGMVAVCIVTAILFYIILFHTSLAVLEIYASRQGVVLEYPVFPIPTVLVWTLGFPALLGLLLWLSRNSLLRAMLVSIMAFYLVSLEITVGGYFGNHFSAAVPVYFALAMLCVHYMSMSRNVYVGAVVLTLILVAAFSYRTQERHLSYLHGSLDRLDTQTSKIDQLLDSCGIERFYAFDAQPFALSRHSLWGPLPSIGNHMSYLGENHPLVTETVNNLIRRNRVFIKHHGMDIGPFFDELLRQAFTRNPPACAKNFLPLERMDLWFREHQV